MSTTIEVLNQIRRKVEALTNQRDELFDKNAQLENEIEILRNNNKLNNPSEETDKIEEERLEVLKRAIKQIDQYTKELDECIQWIEKK